MTTDLATFQPDEQSIANYLGLNPSNPATHAVIAVCQRYDLDPVLKHVIVIPKGGVYITRDGLLHIAHRSGQLDGIVVEQDPTLIDGEWVAKVTVHRRDMRHGFTFPGRYPVNGGNRQYAQEMALKAAEAHALRRAFDVNGLPAYDEQRPDERPQPAAAAGRAAVLGALQPEAPADEPVEAELEPEGITPGQSKALHASLRDLGITDREDGLTYISQTIGRAIGSTKELTAAEAHAAIDQAKTDVASQASTEGADQ